MIPNTLSKTRQRITGPPIPKRLETVDIDNVEYVCTRPDLSSWNPVKFYILRGSETLYGFMPIPVAMRTAHQR